MIPNIANFGDIDNHLRNIDKNNYLSSLRLSVICMDNITAAKNLKIGIIKDLQKRGLITQKQMELAIVRINRYESGRQVQLRRRCKMLDREADKR